MRSKGIRDKQNSQLLQFEVDWLHSAHRRLIVRSITPNLWPSWPRTADPSLAKLNQLLRFASSAWLAGTGVTLGLSCLLKLQVYILC